MKTTVRNRKVGLEMISSEKQTIQHYVDTLLVKAATELEERVVEQIQPNFSSHNFILTYLIKEDKFQLIPETNIGWWFNPIKNKLELNLIPLFSISTFKIDGEMVTYVVDGEWVEVRILSQETKRKQIIEQIKLAMLSENSPAFVTEKYLGSDIKFPLTRESNLFKSFVQKLHSYCYQKKSQKKICSLFNHEDVYHTTLLNLLKEEILENGIGGTGSEYSSLELLFARDNKNNTFISQLFEENTVKELVEKHYQKVKSNKKSLGTFYNFTSDFDLWKEHYVEIKNLYKNKDGQFQVHQYTVINSLETFLINHLLEEGESLIISSSEFQEVIPYLELLEKNVNLTVAVTADEVFGEEEKYFCPKRIDYFYQEMKHQNLYCPVLLTEEEQKEMVEKYHLYKDNPQVKISEPWVDILELISTYNEFLEVEFDSAFHAVGILEEAFQVSFGEEMAVRKGYY